MYVFTISFTCLNDIELSMAQQAICSLLDCYRYNGQIIGREFPITLNNERFEVTCVCPEQDALSTKYNNAAVSRAYASLASLGLSSPEFELKGLECQSDFVDMCGKPQEMVIYSTYLQSCSPVRCLTDFAPIPLYKLPIDVRKPLIKWQENQAACDQLQMNELLAVEPFMIEELASLHSDLSEHGRELAQQIEQHLSSKVYYYLYRVGGESFESEQQRRCPSCNGDWRLAQPLFDLFDFKCEPCRLISNISWDWQ